MFNRQNQSAAAHLTQEQIDVGLRAYMTRVYSYMGMGLALTAAIAIYMATSPALINAVYGSALKWVFFAAFIGMGFLAPRLFFSNNPVVGQVAFWGYCIVGGVLVGGMIAPFLYGFGGGIATVARAFGITAITFLAMSLIGYTTKRDMSGLGGFFAMACIGILIAGLANMFFFESTGFSLLISCVVVLIFSAMMAYETQQIKHMYHQNLDQGQIDQAAVFGAFLLYGSFVVLFSHILNILGVLSGD